MRSSFKLGFCFALTAVGLLGVPACGSDDGGGSGGSKAGGGTGGTGNSGGTGATGGSGGGTAGTSTGGTAGAATNECAPTETGGQECTADPCTCGAESCPSYKIGGLITVKPCCAGTANDACGLQLDSATAVLLSITPGCYQVAQVGGDDTSCGSFKFTNPLNQQPAEFAGCCRADSTCGFAIDLTDNGGPDMGCVEATCNGGAPKACGGGTGGGAGTCFRRNRGRSGRSDRRRLIQIAIATKGRRALALRPFAFCSPRAT